MKAHLLTLCILFGFFLSISLAYGDDIPIHGEWDDEDYRAHPINQGENSLIL